MSRCRSAAAFPGCAFDFQAEQRPQPRPGHVADEGGDQPDPAMEAGGRDSAEIGADIAAEGEAGAIAEQDAPDDGGERGELGAVDPGRTYRVAVLAAARIRSASPLSALFPEPSSSACTDSCWASLRSFSRAWRISGSPLESGPM